MLTKTLNKPRGKLKRRISTGQTLLAAISICALGAALGSGAKLLDNVAILGEIGTNYGVWVFAATLVAYFSRSALAAALHTFLFFAAMLAGYYATTASVFGFFPARYAIVWGGFALVSPVCAYIVWHAGGKGWIAALCASLPIALLVLEGYSFAYTFSIPRGFDLVAAIVLFAVLPKTMKQRLLALPFIALVFFAMQRLNIISLLFGGL